MFRPTVFISATIICFAIVTFLVPAARSGQAAGLPSATVVNRGILDLETGPATDISVRMAQEIASITDDGTTRRVMPVVGEGPLQNLIDLRLLRGIDMAIVQSDALDYAREHQLLPGIESSLSYIAKLYNEEFHLLARRDIKTIGDLANQTVDVGVQCSGSAITAARLFHLLNIKIKMTTDKQGVALQKLRKGEIAALALVAAKPAPFIRNLKTSDGVHLLSVPMTPVVSAAYAPTRITSADYPNLVNAGHPVDTVAVGNVLMAAHFDMMPERSRNLANFVDAFFTNFAMLLKPGYERKWREVNLAADLPGWRRYAPAAIWLRRHVQVAVASTPAALKVLFSRFIDERRATSGVTPMSAANKAALFQQFEDWQHRRAQ